MHNSEYKKSVQIGYAGGGFFNCATKLMGDFAHDGSVPATTSLNDINYADAALCYPLVQPNRFGTTNAMSRERAATTRHYLPEELTCGVAA